MINLVKYYCADEEGSEKEPNDQPEKDNDSDWDIQPDIEPLRKSDIEDLSNSRNVSRVGGFSKR